MTIATVQPLPTGQRERAKDERRRRIVTAAHDLLRHEAVESLSGRTIAAHAGVSLSTVYNLFGSKDAVLAAVYADDLARFETSVGARASGSALERLFAAIEVAIELYAEEPDFYRAILSRRAPGDAVDSGMREPRARFWENLVRASQHEGALEERADAATLSRLLVYLFSGALADWVAGDLPLQRFEQDVTFGFAVILQPFATPQAMPELRRYLARAPLELS